VRKLTILPSALHLAQSHFGGTYLLPAWLQADGNARNIQGAAAAVS
jgi:hypothetical protein